jgi:CrcB protein
MNTLLIILGAAIGAPARYAIDQYIRRFTNKPYGTFSVNILGSFLIGLTFKSSESVNDLLAIGFAGAFTTWSTFMLDLYLAYELRRYKDALINVGASLIFGLLAAWIGVQIVS